LDPNVNFFATWFFVLMIVEWWCPVVLWFTIYSIIDGFSMLTLMKQVVLYLSLQKKKGLFFAFVLMINTIKITVGSSCSRFLIWWSTWMKTVLSMYIHDN
jgi:hypothetical protein